MIEIKQLDNGQQFSFNSKESYLFADGSLLQLVHVIVTFCTYSYLS